jgi:hypothetical protein
MFWAIETSVPWVLLLNRSVICSAAIRVSTTHLSRQCVYSSEPLTEGTARQTGACVYAKALLHHLDVVRNRMFGKAEGIGDAPIAQTASDHRQDLRLPGREPSAK